MTTEVACDLIIESDVAAMSDSCDAARLWVAGENGDRHVWICTGSEDSLPRARRLKRLMLGFQEGAALMGGVLSAVRVGRLLEAVMLARGEDPACRVRKDADDDWFLETEGLPIVVGSVTSDVIEGRLEVRLNFLTRWSVIRDVDGAREALAGLESARPGVEWLTDDRSKLMAVVAANTSQVRTEEDVETVLGVLQRAAVEAEQLAEALGIETWADSAQARPTGEKARSAREEIKAVLTGIAQESEGVELHQYDSYDPGEERVRVDLRDSQDKGGSRLLFATLDDVGDLRIRGDDHGPAVTAHFGEGVSRTEWVRRVDARDVPDLLSHLGADPGESPLEAIARFGERVELALLVDEAVPFHFDSWES